MGRFRVLTGNVHKLVCALALLVSEGAWVRHSQAESPPALVYPVNMLFPSSGFGNRVHPILRSVKHHSGVDIPAAVGSEIRAIANGVVSFSGELPILGRTVTIAHSDSLVSRYAHCSKLLVGAGTTVRSGEVIALVGVTGRTTGAHLHFELRRDSKPLDPKLIFPSLFETPKG